MASGDPGNRKIGPDATRAMAVAWALPFALVVPMVVTGVIGYFLDRWLHTKPAFLLILGFLGVVVGIREAMKTAGLLDKK